MKTVDLFRMNSSESVTSKNTRKDYPDFDEFEEFDFKKENAKKNMEKNLTKGQKLLKKLKFVLTMKKQSELYRRFSEKITGITGEKYGYSTGSLIKVYPDIRLLDIFGEIEKLSKLRSFSSECIVDAEKISYPICEFFYWVLKNSLDTEENSKMMELVDLPRKDQSFLIQILCEDDCHIIQKILIVFFIFFAWLNFIFLILK